MTLSGYGISLQTVEHNSMMINITIIDRFATENNFKVGFIKADIKGFGMISVKGGPQTFIEHRPVFGLSICHISLSHSWSFGARSRCQHR
jgi:hypothetical protein